ncbi:MAG: uracil-DNA glycosylase [Acidobacteria bacterium]|nr:MAG: uracil-DNA glycosylase [Acidobacteriota bacterium]
MSNNFELYLPRFIECAKQLDKIDVAVYEQYEKDPLNPIIGLGPKQAEICIFGRDPGRHEVEHQMPFIGAGGQKVRRELHLVKHGVDCPDFDASIAIGQTVFWANTVPYKPIGNKAWSQKVKKLFKPLMTEVLLSCWTGGKVITLGREAFLWFGIGLDKSARDRLMAFWSHPNRFTEHMEFELSAASLSRTIEIYPLPHPSPLNATWYKQFPGLLRERLMQTGYGA